MDVRIYRRTQAETNNVKPRRSRTFVLAAILLVLAGTDAVLLYKRSQYRTETARLRADMSDIERQRADAIVDAEADRLTLIVQMIRRQSEVDEALHLAVSSESSLVALDRGSVRLRVMPATFGPARRVGVPPDTLWVAVPQGMRRVEQKLGAKEAFDLPQWLWLDRQLPVPDEGAQPGWLGPDAIVTSGGTVFYSVPTDGPLADSSYVMPGSIRLNRADLAAIRDNVTLGMRVYFY